MELYLIQRSVEGREKYFWRSNSVCLSDEKLVASAQIVEETDVPIKDLLLSSVIFPKNLKV